MAARFGQLFRIRFPIRTRSEKENPRRAGVPESRFLIFVNFRVRLPANPIPRNQPEGFSNGRTTGHYRNRIPHSGDGFIVVSNRNAKRSARKGGAFLYPFSALSCRKNWSTSSTTKTA